MNLSVPVSISKDYGISSNLSGWLTCINQRERKDRKEEKERKERKERKRKKRREKRCPGSIITNVIQFSKRQTKYIGRNAGKLRQKETKGRQTQS